jgi:hypothetical protein
VCVCVRETGSESFVCVREMCECLCVLMCLCVYVYSVVCCVLCVCVWFIERDSERMREEKRERDRKVSVFHSVD